MAIAHADAVLAAIGAAIIGGVGVGGLTALPVAAGAAVGSAVSAVVLYDALLRNPPSG